MPELPEVETVARQLAPLLRGRIVRRLRILDPLLRNGRAPQVAGRTIVDVTRSGKRVLFELSPRPSAAAPLWLAVHLRMTGRLLWFPGKGERPEHLRARFDLDRGALFFDDTRRFGTFTWYRSREETAPSGVEPLSDELTVERMAELLRGTRQNVKAWLLRQDRLVGLGNIYAAEILHAARISPFREAASLRRPRIERLRRETRRILREAIENCGTTFSDFQDARGLTGSYQRYLGVYGREGEPCDRCGSRIRRVVQQQRGTFYCGRCQR